MFQIGGGNDDETPTQIIEIPHLLSLLATNHWNGEVQGLNEVNAMYQQQYGPGDYVPERVHPVLVDAGHGLPRRPDSAASPLGGLGGVEASVGAIPVVPARRHLGGDRPVPDEHCRLVPDRKRPPALDRPGLAQNLGRGVAGGQRHVDLDHPDPLHRRVRRVRRRGRDPDGPLRAPAAGRGRRGGAPPSPEPTACPVPTSIRP